MKKMAIVSILLVTIQSSYAFSFMEMIETYMANRARKQEYRLLLLQKSSEKIKQYKLEEAIERYKAQLIQGTKELDGFVISTLSIVNLQTHIAAYQRRLDEKTATDDSMTRNTLNFHKASLKIKVAQEEQAKKEEELVTCNAAIAQLDMQLAQLRTQLGDEVADALEQEDSFGRRLFSRVSEWLWFLPKSQAPRFKLVDGKAVAQ